MKKINVNHSEEFLIAILTPQGKCDYRSVMANIIRIMGVLEANDPEGRKHFVFVHDGVMRGTTSYVVETINKVRNSAMNFKEPRQIRHSTLPLDIKMYGKRSYHEWMTRVIELDPDLVLIFDDGTTQAVQFTKDKASEAGIEYEVVKVRPENV